MSQLPTITGLEFIALFPHFVPRPGVLMRRPALPTRDAKYALPSLSWLRRDFRSYYRAELERLQLTRWTKEDNDCDNRADLYRVLAQVCKARMHLGDGLALAVAYIEYWNVRAGGWHAINAAAVEGRRLVFIEPAYEAGSDITHLTPEEESSIRAIEV